jgi:hypothetical protein
MVRRGDLTLANGVVARLDRAIPVFQRPAMERRDAAYWIPAFAGFDD